MASVPIPKVLNHPSGEKYRVLHRCSGSVFFALNITYGDNGEDTGAWKDGKGTGIVAIKFEPKHIQRHLLQNKARAYNSLAGGPGIPFVHCSGTTEHYRYIVLDLLGPSLEDMFEFCDRKFTLKTILLIADQALSRIEYIHSQSCAHGVITAENLIMGLGMFSNLLHLINVGSAKYPDSHLGADASFRDDLASLGYVLLHFAWPELSWEDLKSTPIEYLCQRLPEEFATYFDRIGNLRSDETPCYSSLRKIFDDLFCRNLFKKDYVFDWTIRKYQKLAEKAKAIAQPEPPTSGEHSSDVEGEFPNSEDDDTTDIEDEFSDSGDESSVLGDEFFDSEDESSIQGEVTPSTDIGPQNTCDITPQLESRPLCHNRLVAEVAGSYAGLFMVENRCIEVDQKYSKPRQANSGGHPKLSSRQYLALIDLHRTQFSEIHCIIVASQNPAANAALHEFASKRKLPTRMFRHGIRPLLDLLRDDFPISRSSFLSFLRLSYSVAALFYETAPKLKASWIECLYELALIFKDVDTEGRAIWEKRIQYWESLRDPTVMDILKADLSDIMSPNAFLVSTAEPCRMTSGKILLQQNEVISNHLSEKKLLELSLCQFTKTPSEEWDHSPITACRDIFLVVAASFVISCYVLRREVEVQVQDITWWGSGLHVQVFDFIDSNFIPDFSAILFLGSCLAFVCTLASFHRRSQFDRYQTYILMLASAGGIFIGWGSGIGVKLIIFGVIPWALCFGMILTIVGHWVWRYRLSTHCIRTEPWNIV